MALRFRKRLRIAPGVTLNLSRSGISTTLGPRGASVNVGKRGTYLNAGLPGTGIRLRERLDKPDDQRTSRQSPEAQGVVPGRRLTWPWVVIGLVVAILVLSVR